MIIYIPTLFIVIMEMILLEITADTFFRKKETVRTSLKFSGFVIVTAALAADVILLQNMFWPRLFFIFLADYVYISWFYRAKVADALGSIIYYYSILTSIDFIALIILFCIPELYISTWLYYGMIFMFKCAELGIGFLIHKRWKMGRPVQAIPKEILRLMYFSGILIWIGSFLKELLYKNNSGDIIVLLIIIICQSEFSVLYLLLAARAELERGRIKAAAVQTQMQLGIYKSKQDLYTEQSKRIHDHKNQLLAICHMLEQNQVPQALKYTRRLTGYMVKELDPIYTNHPIADGILNMKKQEAYDKKISLNYLCGDLKDIILNEEEIIILLGNLLDNAMEAAAEHPAIKSVQAQIIQEEKQLVITVKNSCTHGLQAENGSIRSTKTNDEAHGYGLPAIQDIVERYDGVFAIKQEGEYVKATVVIPVP